MPDLPIPDPIEFKAAVLRSKGRIASGLLHTKAGLLRAGANILAQKANALDKFAQVMNNSIMWGEKGISNVDDCMPFVLPSITFLFIGLRRKTAANQAPDQLLFTMRSLIVGNGVILLCLSSYSWWLWGRR